MELASKCYVYTNSGYGLFQQFKEMGWVTLRNDSKVIDETTECRLAWSRGNIKLYKWWSNGILFWWFCSGAGPYHHHTSLFMALLLNSPYEPLWTESNIIIRFLPLDLFPGILPSSTSLIKLLRLMLCATHFLLLFLMSPISFRLGNTDHKQWE